jgi:hypothetical protein
MTPMAWVRADVHREEAVDADKRLCWKCGSIYGPETVVCVKCGLNLETGEEFETHSENDEPEPPAAFGVCSFLADWVPGLLRPGVVLGALFVAVLGVAVMGYALVLLGMGALIVAVAVGAGGLLLCAHAVAWILVGRFALLNDALVDLQGNQWMVFVVFTLLPVVVGIAVIMRLQR